MPRDGGYKPQQATPIINLASKMDSRTSNEFMDVDPNSTSFTFVNLENADLFNTKSLSTRLGSVDIGGGIIGASGTPTVEYNLLSGSSATTFQSNQFNLNNQNNRYGLIVNFGDPGVSGISAFDLWGLNIPMQDTATSGTAPELGYDVQFQLYINEFKNAYSPSNPTQFYSPNTTLRETNLGGSGVITANLQNPPIAISEPVIINFGPPSNYVSGNGVVGNIYGTPMIDVPIQFAAPFKFNSDTPYYISIVAQNTSGVTDRNIITKSFKDTVDDQINCIFASESFATTTANINTTTNIPNTKKDLLVCEVEKYNPASYILQEYPDVAYINSAPISGAQPGYYFSSISNTTGINAPWNGLTQSPPVDTTCSEFGQVVTLPSGTYEIDGTYLYANTFIGNNYSPFTLNKTIPPMQGYSISFVANLYEITQPYVVSSIPISPESYVLLASYTGTHTFSNPITYQQTNIEDDGIATPLDKIYSVFSNPVTITTDGTHQYLITWQFLDALTFNPLTDYQVRSEVANGNYYQYDFASTIVIGNCAGVSHSAFQNLVKNTSNGFVYVNNGSDNLAAGVMSFPSGNAILGIYDYSIGSSRAEKIIFEQGKNMYAFNYGFPENKQLIFQSGVSGSNDYKWQHLTYQNLLFATQYSFSGTQICWDQIYSGNTGGNQTQPWGLQPQWTMYPVSGTPVAFSSPLYSGATYSGLALGYGLLSGTTVQVMLATQMESGGLRSNVQSFTAPFNNCYIGFSGLDIWIPSGNASNSQYFFDIFPQSTYVFVTPAATYLEYSGVNNGNIITGTNISTDIFFTAEILSGPSGLSQTCVNPLTNSGTFAGGILGPSGIITPNPTGHIYIGDFDPITLQQQIPAVTDYNQSYLDQQVPTPPFKKMVNFYDYTIGVGDPNYPSRMWYTGQLQPQVWGTDGNVAGYEEVSPDDGSPITDIAVFRDNLYVFKYNAIYRYTYTQNPNQPFYRYTMSNTIGNLGFFNSLSTDYGVLFISQFGPALVSLGPPDTIGDEIMNYFQTLDHTDLTFSVGIYDRVRQQAYWSISQNNGSLENNTGLCYSLAERAWNIRKGAMWNAAGIVNDFDNFNQLYIGDKFGQIQQISLPGVNQDTVFTDVNGITMTENISLEGETPWLNMGDSMNLKNLRNIRINCDNSEQILRVDVYYDQDENIIQYSRFINMSVPVINRVCALGGRPCRTVKFVFTTVGVPDAVQIRSIQFTYRDLGKRTNI